MDYIITDACLASAMCECQVHDHHPLNLSDHLLITISLELSSFLQSPSLSCPKKSTGPNLSMAMAFRSLHRKSQISSPPLLSNTPISVSELNAEKSSLSVKQSNKPHLTTSPLAPSTSSPKPILKIQNKSPV